MIFGDFLVESKGLNAYKQFATANKSQEMNGKNVTMNTQGECDFEATFENGLLVKVNNDDRSGTLLEYSDRIRNLFNENKNNNKNAPWLYVGANKGFIFTSPHFFAQFNERAIVKARGDEKLSVDALVGILKEGISKAQAKVANDVAIVGVRTAISEPDMKRYNEMRKMGMKVEKPKPTEKKIEFVTITTKAKRYFRESAMSFNKNDIYVNTYLGVGKQLKDSDEKVYTMVEGLGMVDLLEAFDAEVLTESSKIQIGDSPVDIVFVEFE